MRINKNVFAIHYFYCTEGKDEYNNLALNYVLTTVQK